MGVATPHALGRDLKFFAKTESTYGTFVKPAATDAAKVLKTSFEHKYNRSDRMDSRQTRSLLERITGRQEVTWSVESYLIPSGTAGTPPDIHPLIKNCFGGYTNSPATSDTYAPSNTDSDFGGISMCRHMNNIYMETIFGAWVEQMTLTASGSEEAKLSFEGGAKGFRPTGYSTTDGSYSTGTATVQTADAQSFGQYSVIAIGSNDNTSTGYEVASRSSAVLTLASGTPSGLTAEAVYPFTPTETTAGSPLWGVNGSFTVSGVTVPITAFEFTIKNGIKPINDEHGTSSTSDFILGYREVTGSFGIRLRRDLLIQITNRGDFTTRDLAFVIGSTAGSICTVNVDYAELEFAGVEVPEADEAIITIPWRAKGSSGEDEINMVFT
jgi:hypothetical protein